MNQDFHPAGRNAVAAASDDGRVAFRLTRDGDGFPPADWEHLWARKVGRCLFELGNVPFFAQGVSYLDVVSVEEEEGMNVFREVVVSSGHSTIRIILFDEQLAAECREQLRSLDCDTELSHIPGLIAVDVPPAADLSRVQLLLNDGEAAGRWEYEESAVR